MFIPGTRYQLLLLCVLLLLYYMILILYFLSSFLPCFFPSRRKTQQNLTENESLYVHMYDIRCIHKHCVCVYMHTHAYIQLYIYVAHGIHAPLHICIWQAAGDYSPIFPATPAIQANSAWSDATARLMCC